MATETLEHRVSELERQVALLPAERRATGDGTPYWREAAGRFADDPEFEEAARLVQGYRESLRLQLRLGGLPGSGGRLLLGTWQQVFLLECDVKPRQRAVIVTVVGE